MRFASYFITKLHDSFLCGGPYHWKQDMFERGLIRAALFLNLLMQGFLKIL
jgi:hypothetical protein